MLTAVRQRLSYSNVIATMALFIALGGVAVAAGLPKNSVGPKQIKRGAVTAAKIRKQAVTAAKLAPQSVINGKLAANSVGPGNIGNGAVTTAKLAKGSVIAETIKNSVVTTNKLNSEAVTAPKLGKEAVTTAKLDNEAVTSAKLGKGSVTTAKLSDEIGPLLGTLKSGQTLRGVFDMGAESKSARGATSFQFPLSKTPGISPTDILKFGETNANCSGVGSDEATPQAAPGRLCVYIRLENGLNTLTLDTVNRLGFGLAAFFGTAAESNEVSGMWAVTAP
ncbi:MAG TPA: hypothetical protein VMR96_04575 [Solirubrobacterales bacterium]|nr:hypothetical protein [Solirubrobacterales bacterium]